MAKQKIKYSKKDALLSEDGLYRWSLLREWRGYEDAMTLPSVAFVMINPSKADAFDDDPTIRRCVGFANSWGYHRLEVYNLFAWRATDPAELLDVEDPVGPENDSHLRAACLCDMVVVGWGCASKIPFNRDKQVTQLLKENLPAGRQLYCLGHTKKGHPRHPLFVPADTVPIVFS